MYVIVIFMRCAASLAWVYLNIYQILCVSKYFHQLKNLTNIPNFITPTSFPGTKNQCQKFSFGIWSQVKNLLSHKLISQFINLLSRRNPLKYLCFLVYLKLDWISVFVISHKWYFFYAAALVWWAEMFRWEFVHVFEWNDFGWRR